MTESLFNNENTNEPAFDPNKNYLEDLVGEGKKFKDNEALAKGKAEADEFIKTLTARLDETRSDYAKLREEYNASAKLQELIDKLPQNMQRQPENKPPQVPEPKAPAINPDDVKNIVANIRNEERLQENFNVVQEKLKERFGSNYANVLREQTKNLGLTDEMVNNLARTAPKAFFKTMGLDEPAQTDNFQAPPRSNRRNDNFAPRTEKRNWLWYQELKKNDYKTWSDPKTSVQMHNDVMDMGEAEFYKGAH